MSLNAPAKKEQPLSKARLRLWLKLLKATRHIEGNIREDLKSEFSTTLPRFDVMAALSRFPKGMKMSELSGELKVSNGNVTGIVDRLVKDGFIIREPVPGDRRALVVYLTKRGKDEFARQAIMHENWVNELLKGLDNQAIETMMYALDSVMPKNHEGDKS